MLLNMKHPVQWPKIGSKTIYVLVFINYIFLYYNNTLLKFQITKHRDNIPGILRINVNNYLSNIIELGCVVNNALPVADGRDPDLTLAEHDLVGAVLAATLTKTGSSDNAAPKSAPVFSSCALRFSEATGRVAPEGAPARCIKIS